MAKIIKINDKQIQHIAKLANIKLTPEEIEIFKDQLSDIFSYFAKINQKDTTKVDDFFQLTGLFNITRDDLPGKCLDQQQALSNTKNLKKDYFTVKAIF